MPIEATITLDSGFFLPKEGSSLDVGYYQSEAEASDIRVFVDGEEVEDIPNPFKLCNPLHKKCVIEVRHNDSKGDPRKDGIGLSRTFHDRLLHMRDLYNDKDQEVVKDNFDCVLHFDTGKFRASMVKNRKFKDVKKQDDGTHRADAKAQPTTLEKPISHNVIIHFRLEPGDALELARDHDEKPFWNSLKYGAKERIDIEVASDNSTAEKYYRQALKDQTKDVYKLPNQGDPPPCCPMPPCPEFGG